MAFPAIFYYLITSAFLLATISLACVVSIAVYNIYFHPLRHIPGDKLWATFRFPYLLSMQRGDIHQCMHSMHEEYGPVVRLAPNELSYIDAQAWKDIYGNRPGHQSFERNRTWFKKQSPDEPNSIMGPDEVDHARFRKILVHAFSDKALREQASMIESYVNLLITRLKEKSAGPVDMLEWLNFTTFDIAGDLCFGESFDNLRNGRAHPWVEISYDFGKGLAMIASVNYYPPLSKLLKYMLPEKVRQRMLSHKSMTHEKVAKRLELAKERPDFISTIQGQGDLNQERAMTKQELDINMSVLIFAGSETTASGLTAIIRMLLQNGRHMAKVVEEIRSAFATESEIVLGSVGRLQYLNACIDEGMRLCPPVTIGVPRVVPPGGDTICNQWIPGGTFVTFNQFPAYRSSKNFSNPNDFLPERFLPRDTAELLSEDNRLAYQPFGIGRHTCIGQSLAYAEMRLVLARLFFTFDISLLDEKDTWDWGTQKTYIFWEKKPLVVKLNIR